MISLFIVNKFFVYSLVLLFLLSVIKLSNIPFSFIMKGLKPLKFIIIFFEDWEILYRELLEKKLRNNGFITVSTKDLTGVDLRTEEYSMQDNHHPTEKTWDMLTPEIIKILNL